GSRTMQLRDGVAAATNGRWLPLGRVAWMLTLVLTLALFVAGIPVISAEILTVCDGPACYRWQPTPQLVTELTGFGVPVATYLIYKVGLEVLFVLSFCLIAAVLVWRRSDEPMALFAAFMLVTFGWATYIDTGGTL